MCIGQWNLLDGNNPYSFNDLFVECTTSEDNSFDPLPTVETSQSTNSDLSDNILLPFPIEALGIQDIDGGTSVTTDRLCLPGSQSADKYEEQNQSTRRFTIQRKIFHGKKSASYNLVPCDIQSVQRDDLYLCCHAGFQAEYLRAHLVKYHNVNTKVKKSGTRSLTFRCSDCNNIFIKKMELLKHIELRKTNPDICRGKVLNPVSAKQKKGISAKQNKSNPAPEKHWCFEYSVLPEGVDFTQADPQLWLECPICLHTGNKCHVDTVYHMNCHLIHEHFAIIGRWFSVFHA